MRVAATDRPAFEARAWICQALGWQTFTAEGAAALLDQSPRVAARTIKALVAEGFVEPSAPGTRPSYGGGRGQAWEVSQQGHALASATAARPIQRATADRLLADVLERAHLLRAADRHAYAFTLRRLIVFGSYLGDAPTLNDLDVSVARKPRLDDRDAQHAYKMERVRVARRSGRAFSNICETFMWPHVEAARFLRGGSRAVSLHDRDAEPDFIARIPHRVLI